MLLPEQQDFYARWLQKARQIEYDEIGCLIDKYVTLFIDYNFLYNIIPKRIFDETRKRHNPQDKNKATAEPMAFLTADAIAGYLREKGLDEQIGMLKSAMPHFNIKLKFGHPQKDEDMKLIENLNSEVVDVKILSLLETLYYIRCNIVHGEKGLDQYQELLLKPAIKLLEGIVELLYNKLDI